MSNISTFPFTPSDIDKNKEGVEDIGNLLFNIPIYQRLYAWEEAEIEQLLKDLHRQFEKNRNSTYYLGNLVLYKNQNGRYDVIDGQQRLTTLFLIGLVFKKKYADWSKFLQKEEKIRLAFVAREDDNAFLKAKVENEEIKASENLNAMMTNALRVIGEFAHSNDCKFQQYVYEKNTMIGIVIPEGIDLNKYFEDMNNRGVQLEKHEILKAKLLSKIENENERSFYARLWDACSQLNQYVEYGFEKTLQKIRECLLNDDFISALKKLGLSEEKNSNNLLSILSPNENDKTILENAQKAIKEEADKLKNSENKPNKVGSIINFPTFILHCLKLFIEDKTDFKDYEVKLSDKDLLDIFYQRKGNDTQMLFEKICSVKFIDFLFTCRVLYDAFFIKSIEKNDGKTTWEINNISKTEKKDKLNEFEYERADEQLKEAAVIQAMLNASTSLDNWFTPALKYVLCVNMSKEDTIFCSFLERLDTELAKERMRENKLKEVTDKFMKDFNFNTDKEQCCTYESWFSQNLHNGTSTPRYWFFRLDYYLRKEWMKGNKEEAIKFPQIQGIEQIKSKIDNYQFRQNRSVEHIQPQSKKEGWETVIDNFGNLALISVSSNSSYNDQEVKYKKADFEKRTEKWGIESLKQLAIFNRESWNVEDAKTHSKEMIEILIKTIQ